MAKHESTHYNISCQVSYYAVNPLLAFGGYGSIGFRYCVAMCRVAVAGIRTTEHVS